MRSRLSAVRRDERGFTLTELLITIVILGVLAGIVVFAVRTFTSDIKTVACQADKKSVDIAVDAFFAKNNTYPTGGTNALRMKVLTDGGYLKDAPKTTNGYTISLEDATGKVTADIC